jgi:recombination protein RecA
MNSYHYNIIPTGSLRLDYALGCGGFPSGNFVEIRGLDSSGKTTLCLHTIAEAQKKGGVCAIIDSDFGIYPELCDQYKIDPERLFISRTIYAEDALNILEMLTHSGAFSLIVVDSISSLIPRDEENQSLWAHDEITFEEILSRKLRKFGNQKNNLETCIIFTNLIPDQLSDIYHNLASNLSRLSLGLHAAIRLNLNEGNAVFENGIIIGQTIQVKIIKNTISHHFYHPEFTIFMYNRGVDKIGEILSFGIKYKIIVKQGFSWYHQDQFLGCNYQEMVEFIKENKNLAYQIEKEIHQFFNMPAQITQPFLISEISEQEFNN